MRARLNITIEYFNHSNGMIINAACSVTCLCLSPFQKTQSGKRVTFVNRFNRLQGPQCFERVDCCYLSVVPTGDWRLTRNAVALFALFGYMRALRFFHELAIIFRVDERHAYREHVYRCLCCVHVGWLKYLVGFWNIQSDSRQHRALIDMRFSVWVAVSICECQW